MVMRKIKLVISFLVIAVVILFAGSNDLYAGAGVANPWGTLPAPKGSTTWTGTLVITGQIANVPGLPAPYLPTDAAPTISTQYKDLIVKIEFFVRLENSKLGYATFSGLARDNDGYYFFYALSDYANGRIGEALNRFLTEKVYANLAGGFQQGVLTAVTNDVSNVDTQLRLDQFGRESLQPETPLYFNANITVATY
jgi:hypothetical protein